MHFILTIANVARHRDPCQCPIASTALNLLLRYDILKEDILDVNDEKGELGGSYLLCLNLNQKGKEKKAISYSAHYSLVNDLLIHVGMREQNYITHVRRIACENAGVPDPQTDRQGIWAAGTVRQKSYNSGNVPKEVKYKNIIFYLGPLGYGWLS